MEPAVREAAFNRTCPQCRAIPGQKCAPGPGGRSNLHRDRIWDARRSLEPMPPHQILSEDTDRIYMELAPGSTDTLVLSVHPDVMGTLFKYPYEIAVLFYLALAERGLIRADGAGLTNPAVLMMMSPLGILTSQERQEAGNRLVARGFVRLTAPHAGHTNPDAIRVLHRSELRAQFLMEWNAAKAQWPLPEADTE